MDEYELAPEAERDLLDIALHGLRNFGLAQSEQYRDGLKSRFQEIANNPLQYQAVDSVRHRGLRSLMEEDPFRRPGQDLVH